MASVIFKGRSVPICWASCLKHVYDGHKSRNAFEESLLLVLRSMIRDDQKVILLADRGFGRTELTRFCQNNHFDYVIRINPDVQVRCSSYTGKLIDYPLHKGICKLLRSVAYRQHHSVTQNIVVRWVRNLPAKRDECWFPMSSLHAGPARISRLYGQRMTIEELFRHHKSKRNGWSLRDTKITRADRLDRLLLVLAIAYLLLCGIGLAALQNCKPGQWTASSKNDCSVFTIGRIMLTELALSPAQAFQTLLTATADAVPEWG
ncbi:MAG TPA: transposase [Tepidisphaeraceae bacterium]|nr:transposase [Tepidisphaeraceae bacterium]